MSAGTFAVRRVWARLSYEAGWLRRLRYAAAVCFAAGLFMTMFVVMKLRNLYEEAELYRAQASSQSSVQTLSVEEEASQQEAASIVERYEKAVNTKSYAAELLSLSAQQYRLRVNGIEISEQAEETTEEDAWKPRLFRLRLSGGAADLQMWLEQLEKLPIVIAPSGLQVARNTASQEQSSLPLDIVLECQVRLPETGGGPAEGEKP